MTLHRRLLPPELIPNHLWDGTTNTLSLAPTIVAAYRNIVIDRGLEALATARDPRDPPVGGPTVELTNRHFAQAFDGSVARVTLTLLDPQSTLGSASDAYVRRLAGNTLAFTDAPCGAGAAAVAFLGAIAELRSANILPRHPLDVILIGAEISPHARALAAEMLSELRPALESQGITVNEVFLEWDVTDALTNTTLIATMHRTAGPDDDRLLVVANFNGFLERAGKRKAADPQLSELFRHASGPRSTAMWIEPPMNRAVADGGLFSWIRAQLAGAWRPFARELADPAAPIPTASAMFHPTFSPKAPASVRVAIMPIDLLRDS